MRKHLIVLLLTALSAVSLAASAASTRDGQEECPVVFVNPCDNQECADGETMIINPEIVDEFYMPFPAPLIRNKTEEAIEVTMNYTLNMPHGSFMDCVSGSCYTHTENGDYTTGVFTLAAGEDTSTQCEWSCMSATSWQYEPGTCTAVFTVLQGEDSLISVTVLYTYESMTTGLSHLSPDASAQCSSCFDLAGRRTSTGNNAAGIFLSNGQKILMK